jgi:phage terminase large subunit-like protein
LAQTIKGKFLSLVRLVKAELNKDIWLFLQQAKFEQGCALFPKDASWLQLFLEELLSFPEGMHSYQVDGVSQALAFKAPFRYSDASVGGLEPLFNGFAFTRFL